MRLWAENSTMPSTNQLNNNNKKISPNKINVNHSYKKLKLIINKGYVKNKKDITENVESLIIRKK